MLLQSPRKRSRYVDRYSYSKMSGNDCLYFVAEIGQGAGE